MCCTPSRRRAPGSTRDTLPDGDRSPEYSSASLRSSISRKEIRCRDRRDRDSNSHRPSGTASSPYRRVSADPDLPTQEACAGRCNPLPASHPLQVLRSSNRRDAEVKANTRVNDESPIRRRQGPHPDGQTSLPRILTVLAHYSLRLLILLRSKIL